MKTNIIAVRRPTYSQRSLYVFIEVPADFDMSKDKVTILHDNETAAMAAIKHRGDYLILNRTDFSSSDTQVRASNNAIVPKRTIDECYTAYTYKFTQYNEDMDQIIKHDLYGSLLRGLENNKWSARRFLEHVVLEEKSVIDIAVLAGVKHGTIYDRMYHHLGGAPSGVRYYMGVIFNSLAILHPKAEPNDILSIGFAMVEERDSVADAASYLSTKLYRNGVKDSHIK